MSLYKEMIYGIGTLLLVFFISAIMIFFMIIFDGIPVDKTFLFIFLGLFIYLLIAVIIFVLVGKPCPSCKKLRAVEQQQTDFLDSNTARVYYKCKYCGYAWNKIIDLHYPYN